MFQTKVLGFQGGRIIVLLVRLWMEAPRSYEGHGRFFKQNTSYFLMEIEASNAEQKSVRAFVPKNC